MSIAEQMTPMTKTATAECYDDWFGQAHYLLNIAVTVTCYQRRACNGEVIVRDPDAPANALRTIKRKVIAASTEPADVSARPKRGRRRQTAALATGYYLTETEAARMFTRILNRLNRLIFKKRSRRRHNPERLSVLAVQHDRGTRRHIHALFAVPPGISVATFERHLARACRTEPFVAPVSDVAPVKSRVAFISYMLDKAKSRSGDCLLYVHHQVRADEPRDATL